MKVNTRKLAIFSVSLNVLIVLFLVLKRYHYAQAAPPGMTAAEAWNRTRLATFKDLPINSEDVVFVGNSLTEFFPLDEMFGNPHIKNRGIGFNQSIQLLNRMGPIIASKPRKIFIEIGINDLGNGVPVDSLLKNYERIIHLIQAGSPTTEIYVQSIFPVNKASQYAPAEAAVEKVNPLLKSYCERMKVNYVDIYSALYKNGGLDSTLSWDGTHLNMQGYAVWKNQIAPLIN